MHSPPMPRSSFADVGVNLCIAMPLQSHSCSCTSPGVVSPRGTSTQRPDAGLRIERSLRSTQRWLVPPVQGETTSLAPRAVPDACRHWPAGVVIRDTGELPALRMR